MTPSTSSIPTRALFAESILVKLGQEAGGGLGPDKRRGGLQLHLHPSGRPAPGTYQAGRQGAGPLPAAPDHLRSDPARHLHLGPGLSVLPQVLLELEGDDIYAVGMFGLIYGRYDNLQG